ncbi:hypothetical protein Tco_0503178 [Tanacetum coccineum]
MRMDQYLTFTNHALWEVIVNGDSVSPIASASVGAEGPIPLKTAEHKLARKNEIKAKSTLMLAIPDEHLLKFHACKDAKSLWEAIKNRRTGKTLAARFQKLISQLKIHGEVISQEDANLKLLRSLPSDWNNIALIMRNKYDLADIEHMDDFKNNVNILSTAHEMILLLHSNGSTLTTEQPYVTMAPRNQRNRNRDTPRRHAPWIHLLTNSLVLFKIDKGLMIELFHARNKASQTCSTWPIHLNAVDEEWSGKFVLSPPACLEVLKTNRKCIDAKRPKTMGHKQCVKKIMSYVDLQEQTLKSTYLAGHMTGNKSFLTDYQEIDGGFVAFRGSPKEGKITGKEKRIAPKLFAIPINLCCLSEGNKKHKAS